MKKITNLLLIISFIFFASCVNDDTIENQESQNANKITSRYVDFNEVKNNLKVLNKFNTIKEKISETKNVSLNQNQRLVYLNQFDFFIETDDILLIENEGYKSYTFPIYRNYEVDKTENLVITESNGLVSSYISTYNLSDSDKNNLQNNQLIDLKDKTEITSLESRGSGEPCYELINTPVEWNEQGQVTFALVIAVEVDCPDSDGGGSSGGGGSSDGGGSSGGGYTGGGGWYGNGSGSGDTGGGDYSGGGGYTGGGGGGSAGGGNYPGGGGSTDNPPNGDNTGDPLNAEPSLTDGNGNPIITSPVLSLDNDQRAIKHLMSLVENKPDGTKTNIKTRIDQLNTNRLTSLKENGYMFDNNQNTLPSYNQTSSGTMWANGGQPQYYIMLHMHQDNYIPEGTTTPKPTNVAPSDTDVRSVLDLLDYTGNKNVTSIIVSRHGTFAIKVNDKNKANNAFDAINPSNETNQTWKEFVDKYDDLITDLYLANPTDDSNIMDGFIEFINTHLVNGQLMGLSFYQAVYDSQGNIINWIKL